VWNSRNDDGALLHFAKGKTVCVGPNSGWYLDVLDQNSGGAYGKVDKIRIMDSASC
jgi:hypothetical protein